jgi:hypothetical protein
VICVDFGVGVTQAYSELAALKGAKETVLGGRASSIHQTVSRTLLRAKVREQLKVTNGTVGEQERLREKSIRRS